MMRKVLCIVLVSLCFMGMAGTAQALPLNYPGAVNITIPSSVPITVGQVPVASIVNAVIDSTNGKVDGLFSQDVYDNPAGLLFVYQFTNSASSIDTIIRMTVTEFDKWAILNVGADGSGDQPYFADRANVGTIGFRYYKEIEDPSTGIVTVVDPGVGQGITTSRMWLQTDAKYYGPGTANFIDGGVTTLFAYGPVVPEPASMALLSLGLLGVARFRRRMA